MTHSRDTRFLRLRAFVSVSTKASGNIACKHEGALIEGTRVTCQRKSHASLLSAARLFVCLFKLYYICTGKYELVPSSDESNDCNHVAVHKWRRGYPPRDINAAPRWARARPRWSLDLGPTRDRDLARCSQFPGLIHRRRVAVWCAWEENEGWCVLRA
jgi:hypothetical protein